MPKRHSMPTRLYRQRKRRIALAMALGIGALTGAVVAHEHSEAALRPCADSNGARPGGSVYVWRDDRLTCDVRPPQRLHIVGRIGKPACDWHGGRYANGICWDVDY